VKSICHVPYGTYIWNIIYMGHTMSISMKSICDVCMYIRMYARMCVCVCVCLCLFLSLGMCVKEIITKEDNRSLLKMIIGLF
jgi:hypothetical protein